MKVNTLIKIVFWVLVLKYSICAQAQSSEGLQLYNNYEYLSAVETFENAVKRDSNVYDMIWLTKSYHMAGILSKAKSMYHSLEQDSFAHKPCFRGLAQIYEREDNIARAIKYYNKLVEIDTTNALYSKKLGNLFYKSGIKGDALKYLNHSLYLNPNDITIINDLAVIYMDGKQLEIADSLLERAFEMDSTNIKVALLKSRLHYLNKEYDEVCDVLKMTSRITDLDNYYNKMLGFSYLQIDSLDEAIFHLTKSLVNESSPEHAHYYLGLAHYKLEEEEDAKYHFEKAIDAGISDNIGLYHYQLALIYQENKDLKLAMKHFEQAYYFNKKANMLYHYARCADEYYKDKQVALRWYTKYLDKKPKNITYSSYSKERINYLKEQLHFGQ